MQIFIHKLPTHLISFTPKKSPPCWNSRWPAQVLGAAWTGRLGFLGGLSWFFWVSWGFSPKMSWFVFPFFFGGGEKWWIINPTSCHYRTGNSTHFWLFSPRTLVKDEHMFSDGLVQPPTSKLMVWVVGVGCLGFCYERDCFFNRC